uniref:Uncharacterized protein n=1 Tax=Anguilla anguilla TaxID=7936 RepID=A0A0E9UPM5_ANGAN
MASMFLRSSNSCAELSPSRPESRRWWAVTHSVPLMGAWKGRVRTTFFHVSGFDVLRVLHRFSPIPKRR